MILQYNKKQYELEINQVGRDAYSIEISLMQEAKELVIKLDLVYIPSSYTGYSQLEVDSIVVGRADIGKVILSCKRADEVEKELKRRTNELKWAFKYIVTDFNTNLRASLNAQQAEKVTIYTSGLTDMTIQDILSTPKYATYNASKVYTY